MYWVALHERPSGQAGLDDPFGVPSGLPDRAC
jgi:hypothetical protein